MTNTALLLDMIRRYDAKAYTHNYIFGFRYKGNVYMAYADHTVLPAILKLDNGSRGVGMALRFVPNNSVRLALMPKAELICSTKYFDEVYTSCKYNRGEVFEKLVTEHFGQTWEKDNVPFTDDGDITVDGIAYQIKFQKATFCNEKSIANLEK